MGQQYLSIRQTEQQVLASLEMICRLLWRMSSPETQQEYPRFSGEHDDPAVMEGEALTPEHNKLVGFAFSIFETITGESHMWAATEPDIWLRELSLFICRLAGEATLSDVEYHFCKRLAKEGEELNQARLLAAMPNPPGWVSTMVGASMKRFQYFKKEGLTFLMEKEAELSGGDNPLTKRGRVSWYLYHRVTILEEVVGNTTFILGEMERRNYIPAMLELNSNLDPASAGYKEVLYGLSPSTGEKAKKPGPLATFLRAEGEAVALDLGAVDTGYLLLTALLEVLQPNAGHA